MVLLWVTSPDTVFPLTVAPFVPVALSNVKPLGMVSLSVKEKVMPLGALMMRKFWPALRLKVRLAPLTM